MEQENQIIDQPTIGAYSALAHAREFIAPYLPPPVLSLIQTIDTHPQITKYVEHEPFMTILSALVAIYIFKIVIKFISFRGKAVEGLDNDEPEKSVLSNLKDEQFEDSVILFGPCATGKSLLFHQLTKTPDGKDAQIQTVMSLKANVKVVDNLRIVDYPGHVTLSSKLASLLLPQNTTTRAILVVDSTKSLSDAAIILYKSVLTNSSLINAWRKAGKELNILVVCNKHDARGAKNWRRVKIQLRSELDKLKKIASSLEKGEEHKLEGDDDVTERFELSGKGIDLDDLSKNGLDMLKLNFASLSAKNGDGMDEFKAFVENGEVLTNDSSILKSRR